VFVSSAFEATSDASPVAADNFASTAIANIRFLPSQSLPRSGENQPNISSSGSTFSFTAYVGVANPSGLSSFASEVGIKPTLALDGFNDQRWSGIDDDTWVINAWRGSDYRMIWSVPMLPQNGPYTLAAGAAGAYNHYFSELARNLVRAGMGNSILRLGWEFNVSSYSWYAAGKSAKFVAYWRQVVKAMRAVPGANFSFEWDPSRGDNGAGDRAIGNLESYYPGNKYVEIIGMDIYDAAWDTYPGAAAEFQTILTQKWGLNWLSAFATEHHEPIAIPEFGLGWGTLALNGGSVVADGPVGGGDDKTFIDDMINWADHENVVDMSYWDYSSSAISTGSNPLVAAALKADLGADS
jgi:hypothetical protein